MFGGRINTFKCMFQGPWGLLPRGSFPVSSIEPVVPSGVLVSCACDRSSGVLVSCV